MANEKIRDWSEPRLELFFRLEVNKLKAQARSSFFLFQIQNLFYECVGLGKSSKWISQKLETARAFLPKLELGSGSMIFGSTFSSKNFVGNRWFRAVLSNPFATRHMWRMAVFPNSSKLLCFNKIKIFKV